MASVNTVKAEYYFRCLIETILSSARFKAKEAKLDRAVTALQLYNFTTLQLIKWMGMSFNFDKCKVMHVGWGTTGMNIQWMMRHLIKRREVCWSKYSKLIPTRQCKEAARKANGVLTQIAKWIRIGTRSLSSTLRSFSLRNTVPAWNPWTLHDKEVIKKVQVRSVGMISGLKWRSYSR